METATARMIEKNAFTVLKSIVAESSCALIGSLVRQRWQGDDRYAGAVRADEKLTAFIELESVIRGVTH
jgi:hypothetical protein